MEVSKIKLTSENVSIAKYADEFIIRIGVWNHIEILFTRKEFEKNNSDYDYFIDTLEGTFQEEGIEEQAFCKDEYIKGIKDQLIGFRVLGKINEIELNGKEEKVGYIVDDVFKSNATKFFAGDIITVSEIEIMMDDVLLTKVDYLKYEDNLEKISNKLQYDRLVILCTCPKISVIKKLNRFCVEKEIPYVLGLLDGNFIVVTAFNSNYTGCFECLEKSSSARIQGLSNYLTYLKNEKNYKYLNASKESFDYICSFANLINKINYFNVSSVLEGKVFSIYLPTFEVHVERLLRTPLCTTCGHISVRESTDYNITTRNAINELMKNEG